VIATLVAASIAAFSAMAQAEAPADFAYRIPLALTGEAAFHRVELPAPVHEGTVRGDLGDVRVFNGDGAPVAYAFLPRPAAERAVAGAVELPFFPLRVDTARRDLGDVAISVRRDAAGTTVDLATRDGKSVAALRLVGYLVDASAQNEPLAALALPMPAGANLTTRVRVDASDDLMTWRMLVTGAPLVELEYGGRRLSRDRVELPPIKARYLRASFEPGQPAAEVVNVRGEFADRAVEAPRSWRAAAGGAPHTGEVDRLTLELPEQNTIAPTQILVRATPKEEWRPIASTVFYRLRQDGGDVTNPPLAVAGNEYRYWKVRIDPKAGGIGAKPPTLSAGGYPRVIVFAARGNPPFELAYGSARASSAALPIETLVPGYDRAKTVPASFALARAGAPNATPSSDALATPIDTKRWLLWGSLVLAAAVLGWMAWTLSKQMRTAAPADAARDAPPETRELL
jgi:hypothetical protein